MGENGLTYCVSLPMTLDAWFVYVAAVLIFMMAPGPSHLLMIATGLKHGLRRSLATAAGDLTANAIQMTLAGLGLATALAASRHGFAVMKWAGVGYLAWMGARQLLTSFRAASVQGAAPAVVPSVRRLWLTGFLTSAANPKAVVFFAALFPQFIDPTRPLALQLLLLGGTYLVIDGLFLSIYGASAGWLAARSTGLRSAVVERLSGLGLLGSAGLLALKSPTSSS